MGKWSVLNSLLSDFSLYPLVVVLLLQKKTSHQLLIATASGFHPIINFYFFYFGVLFTSW